MASESFFGIDVASRELAVSSAGGETTIANTAPAITAWLLTLPLGSHIGVEATSHYHELVADLAVSSGMLVYVLNPRDTRHYMLGLGRRSKTDRVDAHMIRRFIQAEHNGLRPYQPAATVHRQLALLQRRRASVVRHRQALNKALRQVDTLASALDETLCALDQLLAQIDQQLAALLNSQGSLKTMPSVLKAYRAWADKHPPSWRFCSTGSIWRTAMRWSRLSGLIPEPAIPAKKRAAGDFLNGVQANCGACCTIVPRPPPKPNPGSLTIPSLKPANFQRPKPW